MFRPLLIKFYLILFNLYHNFWQNIFTYIGRISIIYYANKENKLQNITLNYYSGYNLTKYKSGDYYVKFYDKNGINHIALNGNINDLQYIKTIDTSQCPMRRKNITLYSNDKMLKANLEILDNYKTISNSITNGNAITDLEKIFGFLNLECTHIKIIEIFPFTKKIYKTSEINLGDLYYDYQ